MTDDAPKQKEPSGAQKVFNFLLALVLTPFLFAWVVGMFVFDYGLMSLAALAGLGFVFYAFFFEQKP